MTAPTTNSWLKRLSLGIATIVASYGPVPMAVAQIASAITADGTLGTTVRAAGGEFQIDGGAIRGANQFHSFGQFTVGSGDSAIFSGPSGIQNILSRVTGGSESIIDGTLSSTVNGANLFLMNPSGVMFGPGARLDLSGSFHATTADYIDFADGTRFTSATTADAVVLSSAAPAAFGFLKPEPAGVDLFTSNLINVRSGNTMSFVGGTVNVGMADGSLPGFLLAQAGRINLTSVASAGVARFDGTGIDVTGFSQLGEVNVLGGSIVDGREIFIRGGKLVVDDSLVFGGAFSLLGLPVPPPDGGQVNIDIRGDVMLTGTRLDPVTDFQPGIVVFSGELAGIAPPATVPDINIRASSLSISGFAGIQSGRLGPGEPGSINVSAQTVTTSGGGSITLANLFEGPGGALTINARDVTLSGDGSPNDTGVEGIGALGLFHPTYFTTSIQPALTRGDSGNVFVNATGTLSVLGEARITSDSENLGRAGNTTVNATKVILVGTGNAESGSIGSQSILAGDSGRVEVRADTVEIKDGFRLSATTGGSGDGGELVLSARQLIEFTGSDSRLLSATLEPSEATLDALFGNVYGVTYQTLKDITAVPDASLMDVLGFLSDSGLIQLDDLTPGDAGTVSITTPVLTMGADTRIETSTGWEGNAGAVLTSTDDISMRDGASIRSRSGVVLLDGTRVRAAGDGGLIVLEAKNSISLSGSSPRTGDFTAITTSTLGEGDGGDVTMTAPGISITDGAQVTAVSEGAGSAGTVTMRAAGTVRVEGLDSEVSTSAFSTGDGGLVSLSAPFIFIGDRAKVTADSSGSGLTGDISLRAGSAIRLEEGSISTSATTSDGGNIELLARDQIHLTDSVVSTSVESGVGGGGNILLDPEFVVLNKSDVIANAFGGPGGNIRIVAGSFVPSADSVVEASSQLGVQGTIVIESPENDIAGQIAQLPRAYLDVSHLLPERCTAQRSESESSFIVTGRGGLPSGPDGYLPSSTTGRATFDGGANLGGDAVPALDLQTATVRERAVTLSLLRGGCNDKLSY